jgi:hypothetical protein
VVALKKRINLSEQQPSLMMVKIFQTFTRQENIYFVPDKISKKQALV